ncbi:DUF1998 domain-containing protein [Fibrobacter sp. UWB7]|uniref:DUF1998 domain-containing protein n=1 Tax=Fibrobacter sp. UWB7 TaxID=1896206 RepID=UPI00091EC92D|nr:DUF1998 domain-containing protein [Fibrobacter sp. UWB7]SHM17438.1 protein of unknown function [Fibrobacter sp. UWB7]
MKLRINRFPRPTFGRGATRTNEVKNVGSIRRSQIITTFGPGAIADMVDMSVIIASPEYWSDAKPIREPNLEHLLKVSNFCLPPYSERENSRDIPAYRFPYWVFCQKCHALAPYWKMIATEQCNHKNGKKELLVPSRFVCACPSGHLEDFPYSWWVHKGDFVAVDRCDPEKKYDNLKINFQNKSGGLESIVIECTKCGQKRSMAGSMGKDSLSNYRCRGKRPWLGNEIEDNDPNSCEEKLRVLQRGAANVYFTVTSSALTIPPWSEKIRVAVMRNSRLQNALKDESYSDDAKKMAINMSVPDLVRQYGVEKVYDEMMCTIKGPDTTKPFTKQKMYEDEYSALCNGNNEGEWFCSSKENVSSFLQSYISQMVLVTRLREVLALRGFYRVKPEGSANGEYMPLSRNKLDWLPAIEMLGEGIFIRLDEQKVAEWEKANSSRYEEMDKRLKHSGIRCDNFSARYVLLHTLSHLLIRQLSIESGYSGSSIRERIYSSYKDGLNMAGVLLYTSSSDSDGSLGGLVRKGTEESFEQTFRSMLQGASWCSSDPICVDSLSQGTNGLNYAACHACTLLPETCCEMRNCLLDRAAVVGKIDQRDVGFFENMMERI